MGRIPIAKLSLLDEQVSVQRFGNCQSHRNLFLQFLKWFIEIVDTHIITPRIQPDRLEAWSWLDVYSQVGIEFKAVYQLRRYRVAANILHVSASRAAARGSAPSTGVIVILSSLGRPGS